MPTPPARATITSGPMKRTPNTGITRPQVRKKRCWPGVSLSSTRALTTALSNDNEISRASSTRVIQAASSPITPSTTARPAAQQPRGKTR